MTLMIAIFASLLAFLTTLGCMGLGFMARSIFAASGDAPEPSKRIVDSVVCGYLALITISSLLSFRVWSASGWWVYFVWAMLFAGGLYLISRWWFFFSGTIVDFRKWGLFGPGKSLLWKCLVIVLLIGVLIDAIWAGLPLYRYDQWSYHLIVSQWISRLGTLAPPISDDHIFFTGVYEYMGLLPRALFDDDAFQQGFQNSLTVFLVAFPGILLGAALYRPKAWAVPWVFAMACVSLFATGDHEALANAKPDYVIMMMSVCVMLGLGRLEHGRVSGTVIGAILVGALAFKLTWLHFAIAAAPAVLWNYVFNQEDWRHAAQSLLKGAMLGVILLSPFLIKNFYFFGNPVHPIENPFWRSLIWDDGFRIYWSQVSIKPQGLSAYLRNVLDLLTGVPRRLGWFVAIATALLSFGFLGYRRHGRDNRSAPERDHDLSIGLTFASVLILYVMLWGFFYHANIADRFVSPMFGIGLAGLFILGASSEIRGLAVLVATIPFVVNSQAEVSLYHLGVAASRDVIAFHDFFVASPSADNQALRVLRQHREQHYPSAQFNEASMMSDSAFSYYGATTRYLTYGPYTRWLIRQDGIDPDAGCLKDFLIHYQIRYLWNRNPEDPSKWFGGLRALTPQLEELPVSRGRLWHISDYARIQCEPRH